MHRVDVFSPPHPEQFWQNADGPLSPGCWEWTVESPHALLPVHPTFPTAGLVEDMPLLVRQLENKGQAGSVSLEGSKQWQQVRNLCG